MRTEYKNVEEYLNQFPDYIREKLELVRATIKKAAPDAEEVISYGMPGYKLNKKPLVYFAGYNTHIGFYATPTGHSKFAGELSQYRQGKGSVQFPLNQPLPLELISRITRFRMEENTGMHSSPV
jgi:uncharacterized protein YdhG (YjbR/CyaY superfamily)